MRNGSLFILSNRLPVTVTKREGKLKILPSSGGLVSAMQGFLQNAGNDPAGNFSKVHWVGVPGCSKETWDTIKDQYEENYNLIPVYVPARVYDGYYNSMSNSVIWPLFHYFPSYAEYSETGFRHYVHANELFLESVLPHLDNNDTVWIHDYQLMPLARMIRQRFPNITIGFFLHIPFPSFEIFRLLPHPWQEELLHGMLGADLIGFHTIDYAIHFLKCLQMKLGLEHENSILRYDDRLVRVDVFPISIDYEKFKEAYSLPEVLERRKFYSEQFEGKKIIFSVDRLDYSKNVLGRLKGYERFFLQYPEYKEQVVFILAVVPSRDNIANYMERKKEIDEFIGGFNARIGTIVWKPVIYQYAHLPFEEMIALYSCCNIALITPLRDGMNLVSKEFVATRQDKQGVLVLSEMAGAARELTDAVLINPNDINGLAEKMHFALEMPKDEQEKRMSRMQQRISEYSVSIWAEDFLEQLEKIKKQQGDFEFIFLDQPAREELKKKFLQSERRLILLDYDGTLVNFAPLPHLSAPTGNLLDVLRKLSQDPANSVYIISGRNREALEEWLGELPVNLVAEHGALTREVNGEWASHPSVAHNTGWKEKVGNIMRNYVKRCANSFVEEKNFSLVWHYRNVDSDQGNQRAKELLNELTEYAHDLNIHVMPGNKIVEAKINGVDKGVITEKIAHETDYDFILACGDDKTDEDMFRSLMHNDKAYTIKVGSTASYAKYNVLTPYMLNELLEMLCCK